MKGRWFKYTVEKLIKLFVTQRNLAVLAYASSATTAAWFLRCAASSGVKLCQPRIDLSAPCVWCCTGT